MGVTGPLGGRAPGLRELRVHQAGGPSAQGCPRVLGVRGRRGSAQAPSSQSTKRTPSLYYTNSYETAPGKNPHGRGETELTNSHTWSGVPPLLCGGCGGLVGSRRATALPRDGEAARVSPGHCVGRARPSLSQGDLWSPSPSGPGVSSQRPNAVQLGGLPVPAGASYPPRLPPSQHTPISRRGEGGPQRRGWPRPQPSRWQWLVLDQVRRSLVHLAIHLVTLGKGHPARPCGPGLQAGWQPLLHAPQSHTFPRLPRN
nr:collagen alpha-1(I) chain-like [Bubalus bubalis]